MSEPTFGITDGRVIEDREYRTKEAAKLLGVKPGTIIAAIGNGGIHARKEQTEGDAVETWHIPAASLVAYDAKRRRGGWAHFSPTFYQHLKQTPPLVLPLKVAPIPPPDTMPLNGPWWCEERRNGDRSVIRDKDGKLCAVVFPEHLEAVIAQVPAILGSITAALAKLDRVFGADHATMIEQEALSEAYTILVGVRDAIPQGGGKP